MDSLCCAGVSLSVCAQLCALFLFKPADMFVFQAAFVGL